MSLHCFTLHLTMFLLRQDSCTLFKLACFAQRSTFNYLQPSLKCKKIPSFKLSQYIIMSSSIGALFAPSQVVVGESFHLNNGCSPSVTNFWATRSDRKFSMPKRLNGHFKSGPISLRTFPSKVAHLQRCADV